MKELISVIIPIYKVEKYLHKCVDSILKQTYRNIEIILVDDGSPDNCGNICDEYASKDKRIIVIHKKNGGLSDARNVGLKVCTGEYITFIDSDDYVLKDYCQTLFDLLTINNADVSCVPICKCLENGKRISCEHSGRLYIYTAAEAMSAMFENNKLSWCAPAKLYRRNLFINVEYPVGKLMEDKLTTYKIYDKCSKIVYKDVEKYMYLLRHGSIMNSNLSEKHLDSFNAQLELNKFIEKNYPYSISITHAYTTKVALMFLCSLSNEKRSDLNKYSYFQKYVDKYEKEFLKCKIIDIRYKLLFIILNLLFFLKKGKAYTGRLYTGISRIVIAKKQT